MQNETFTVDPIAGIVNDPQVQETSGKSCQVLFLLAVLESLDPNR
jgi:hypothetical protein